MEPPRFTHDCEICQFLGRYREYDLYYCKRSDGGTVLARYGDEGYEYSSAPINVLIYAGYSHESPLVEALRRQLKIWQGKGDKQ